MGEATRLAVHSRLLLGSVTHKLHSTGMLTVQQVLVPQLLPLHWPNPVVIVEQHTTTVIPTPPLTAVCGKSIITGIQNALTLVHLIAIAMLDVQPVHQVVGPIGH